MYYFTHHTGDYAVVARSFSMMQDGAYLRLLSAYITREKPLPAEKADVYLLAHAKKKADRDAVDQVLHALFELGPDGWRNKEADRQLNKYRDASENGRLAANTRWGNEGKIKRSQRKTDADAMRSHSGRIAIHEPPTTNQIVDDPSAVQPQTKHTHIQPSAETGHSQPEAEPVGRLGKRTLRPVESYPIYFQQLWNAAPRRKNDDLPDTFAAYERAVERLAAEQEDPHAFLLFKVRVFAAEHANTDIRFITNLFNWLENARYYDGE